MMAQRIDRLSVMTEAAANIVERYRQKVDKGEMAEAAAREAALADIAAMRHGRDNYVYVNDAAGTVVAHPSAKVVGRNLMGMADPTGFRFVADVMPRAKRDGVATFRYVWAQEGQAAPVPKIGLFRYYAPWDIYIGVSEYVSDLRAMIVEQVERLAVAGFLIMLVLGGASLLIVRSVVRPMARLRATMGTLAEDAPTSRCRRPGGATRSGRWPVPSSSSATTPSSASACAARARPRRCAGCAAPRRSTT